MTQKAAAQDDVFYQRGTLLFQQGEPGGDLFFVKEGKVEVFVHKDHQDVRLTLLGPGEVLGVLTCTTNEPRLASARAYTDVMVRRVAHEAIKKSLGKMPQWMATVIKEFTIRIKQMNDQFARAQLTMEKMAKERISRVYTAMQVCHAAAVVADLIHIVVDERPVVVVDDLLDKLEETLGLERTEVQAVFDVMTRAGLVRREIEPDRKRKVVAVEVLRRLPNFAEFVRNAKTGKERKLVAANISHKHQQVLFGITKFAKHLDLDLSKEVRISDHQLRHAFRKVTGVDWSEEVGRLGTELGLLRLSSTGDETTLFVVPDHVSRSLTSALAIRALQRSEQGEDEEDLLRPAM